MTRSSHDFMDEAKAAMDTDDKNIREARWNEMIEHWHEKYLEEYPDMDQYLEEITYKFQKMIVKKWLLEGHRVDGRQKNEIRPLSAEVGVLPRAHGSGLFTRGQTQVLSVCTLDTLSANQKLDTIWEETEKRYMHHYNFPGYSVGEAKPARSAPAGARSATARWQSVPCCPSFPPWRSSPTPSAWSARWCPLTVLRPRAPSAAVPWPSWMRVCLSPPLWPAFPAA